MTFYIWDKPGFKNLKRKRVANAKQQNGALFYGKPVGELRGLDSYAVVEDWRIKRA